MLLNQSISLQLRVFVQLAFCSGIIQVESGPNRQLLRIIRAVVWQAKCLS